MLHPCSPSTGEAEPAGSLELAGQLALSNPQVPGSSKWETLSWNKKWGTEDTWHWPPASTYIETRVTTHLHTVMSMNTSVQHTPKYLLAALYCITWWLTTKPCSWKVLLQTLLVVHALEFLESDSNRGPAFRGTCGHSLWCWSFVSNCYLWLTGQLGMLLK